MGIKSGCKLLSRWGSRYVTSENVSVAVSISDSFVQQGRWRFWSAGTSIPIRKHASLVQFAKQKIITCTWVAVQKQLLDLSNIAVFAGVAEIIRISWAAAVHIKAAGISYHSSTDHSIKDMLYKWCELS